MQKDKKMIGLHVRLQDGLLDVISQVRNYNLPVAQSFLLNEQGEIVSLKSQVMHQFVKEKTELNFLYFVHAAYWCNLVKINSKEFISLCKETEIARDLSADGIVIHIGATRQKLSKLDQVKYIAESINELLYQVPEIPLFLENGPHAGRNFGGDLLDFELLFQHIPKSDRIQFCLDTAHAFVFGYNLSNEFDLKKFLSILDTVFKDKTIGLLHLNDTPESSGSYIDKHEVPGKGNIGKDTLQKIMQHCLSKDTPIILELPAMHVPIDIFNILEQIHSWNTQG